MGKYRKKPVITNAWQFTGEKPDPPGVMRRREDARPYVVTAHEQRSYLVPGDWVIPEGDGKHFYPCKDDIFQKTYEPFDEGENPSDPRAARVQAVRKNPDEAQKCLETIAVLCGNHHRRIGSHDDAASLLSLANGVIGTERRIRKLLTGDDRGEIRG